MFHKHDYGTTMTKNLLALELHCLKYQLCVITGAPETQLVWTEMGSKWKCPLITKA